MNQQHRDTPPAPQESTSWQLILVGGLMVLIIALLATLWLRERSRRMDAQKLAYDLAQRVKIMQSLSGGMGMGFPGLAIPSPHDPNAAGDEGLVRPVQREDLVVQPVEFQGHRRPMVRVSAAAGQRLGFHPGDLVLVAGDPNAP